MKRINKVLLLLVAVLTLSSCTTFNIGDDDGCQCTEITSETITYYIDGTNEFGFPISTPVTLYGQNVQRNVVICQEEVSLEYIYNEYNVEIGTRKVVCNY